MARFCPNCGTEVEDTAVFCPTCGQPIDQVAESEIPPAPAWPDQPARDVAEPASVEPASVEDAVEDAWHARFEDPTSVEEAPRPDAVQGPRPSPPTAQRPPPRDADPPAAPISLPVTMPVTISAWLIGVGVAVAALGILIGLFGGSLRPIDLILLVALLGIAATIFFSANVPAIPNLRLMTFVIVLLGFGMAIDRIMLPGAGASELLFFLGAAAAAIGAILLELGRDQPLGGPQVR